MTQTIKKPDSQTAHPPPAAQPVAAPEQDKRITPALWMPAAPTIAWLAFSSAETDWDAKFYFGASIWYAADPERVLDWLREVEDRGDLIEEFQPDDFQRLHRFVMQGAATTDSFQAAKAAYTAAKARKLAVPIPRISEDHIREAARTLRTCLEEGRAEAERAYDTIWSGSEKLCHALARGDLTAYGWPGRGPDFSDHSATQPARETIPRDVFRRPVTVTQDGVFAFARGDDSIGYYHEVLWSGLLFRANEFHALSDATPQDQPSPPDSPPDRGGIAPKHDWPPFQEECRQHLQKLRANPPDGDLKRALNEHMQGWAKDNMTTNPRYRTVSRAVNDVFCETTTVRTRRNRTRAFKT